MAYKLQPKSTPTAQEISNSLAQQNRTTPKVRPEEVEQDRGAKSTGKEEPDTSVQRLEKIFHKQIDEGYESSPTNDKYVVTKDKPRGKAVFPLILINQMFCTKEFTEKVIELLKNVQPIGEIVPVMHLAGNKKAVFMCSAYANKATFRVLNKLCIKYRYYTAPGVVQEDLEFDEYLDMDLINKDIISQDSNNDVYFGEEEAKELEKRKVGSVDLKKDILRIISEFSDEKEADDILGNTTYREEVAQEKKKEPETKKQEPVEVKKKSEAIKLEPQKIVEENVISEQVTEDNVEGFE